METPVGIVGASLTKWGRRTMLRYGSIATLHRPARNVFQPATGTFANVTETTQGQSFEVRGFFDKSDGKPVQGGAIGGPQSDTHTRSYDFLIPEHAEVPFDALAGWTLTLAGRNYSVRRADPEIVRGAVVFYRLVLDAA